MFNISQIVYNKVTIDFVRISRRGFYIAKVGLWGMNKTKGYLKPLKNKSVVQQVIDRLTRAIINKELRPGDKIPTENELAETFGAARNSVREAVKVLVSFGVLVIRRPEGTFVADGFSDTMIDPLLYGIILDDTASMASLLELRSWNDTGMLRLAINKATEEDIAMLKEALENLQRQIDSGDFEKVFDGDNEFHRILALITHNSLFGKIDHITRLLTTDVRHKTLKHMLRTDKGRDLMTVHIEIYDAIKNKDKDKAEEIIRRSYFYDEGALEG